MRCLLIVLMVATCAEAETAAGKKATRLFDGQTLQGWEGNLEFFRVQDSAVVAGRLTDKIPRNEFLCTKKKYRDFVLKLKVKTVGKGANAGIQIRSQRIPDHHEVRGYQADVGEGWWGKLYDESRRNRVLAGPTIADAEKYAQAVKLDDWNDYEIRCEGSHIKIWINGYQTVDYVEPDKEIPLEGIIGLQIHSGPATEAWYKDITIRELK